MALVSSVFKRSVQVPTNWVAATPALSKRTNKLRETATPRRARLIKEVAKEKTKSVSKLSYLDAPVTTTPGPALGGTGKPELLLILICYWQGPAPADGPRPRLKRKAAVLWCKGRATSSGKGRVTSSGKGQSASQPEPSVTAARSSGTTSSLSQVHL